MLDWVPVRAWILILLATFAYGPARYVFRHLRHSPSRRDITGPPEDLSWRTSNLLRRNVMIVAILAGVGIFIFTPLAVRIAHSRLFLPTILTIGALWALDNVIQSWRRGTVEPWVRGFSRNYKREQHPKRFWVALSWNAAVSVFALLASNQLLNTVLDNPAKSSCTDQNQLRNASDIVAACTSLINSPTNEDAREVARYWAHRGIAYHRLGAYDEALRDYGQAIRLNPADAASHYNRGLIFQDKADVWNAEIEFAAALRLHPDSSDARKRLAEVSEILRRHEQTSGTSLEDQRKAASSMPVVQEPDY